MRRALVVAAVAGLFLVGASTAQAVFPAQDGRIAYVASDGAIHTVLPSGHGDTAIGQGFDPTWSPNGRRLAFLRAKGSTSENIYTMRADGSDVRQLTFGGLNTSPSYSPHGRRIVFLHTRSTGETAAVTMRTDGSHRRTIAKDVGPVTWSPAGRIAYQARGHRQTWIWTMRPDGTHRHRLVHLGSFVLGSVGDGPFYSPNGRKFIYTDCTWGGANSYSCSGFIARANGSDVRPTPCNIELFVGTTSGGGRTPLTYAPDGKEFLVGRSLGSTMPWRPLFNIVRLAFPSCTEQWVVGPLRSADADWQALPAP